MGVARVALPAEEPQDLLQSGPSPSAARGKRALRVVAPTDKRKLA